jgi:hypothetical protein
MGVLSKLHQHSTWNNPSVVHFSALLFYLLFLSAIIRVDRSYFVFSNCQLLIAGSSLPRITTDFSIDFHIRKNRKNCTTPAWILNFTNRLHRFL